MTTLASKPLMSTLLTALLAALAGCATIVKPCSRSGDFRWQNALRGTMRCQQVKQPDGRIVNHGTFQQFFPDGKSIQLQGEFNYGKMNGLWVEYNDKKEPIIEKYFENGIERAIPLKK